MKEKTRARHARIRHILEAIRVGTRTGRFPSASDFARELEVSWRTIMRDLDFLRDEDKAPIEYDASRKGYFLSDPNWQLPPITLNRSELFAFSIARKLMTGFRGTPLEIDMQSLFEKIADSLKGKVTIDPGVLTERFTVLGDDHVMLDPETWSAAAKLTDRQEAMRVMYQKFDGDVKTYTLMPLHLVYHHGNWYVLACPKGRERVQTFALSRMQAIEGTGDHFEIPEWFDLKKYLDESFGIVSGEEVFRVRLLFSKKIATYIRERVWHPSQEIIERKSGDVELRFETAGWKELVRWILSWQPDVKVLSPKKLRERIKIKLRQSLELRE
jgi:proteasome accessory factor B